MQYICVGLTQRHMDARVESSLELLERYGFNVEEGSEWGRMVITDESSGVKLTGKRNAKMDRVWALSDKKAGHLLDFQTEKFDSQFMIWGGISYQGLVPSDGPIFMGDLKEEFLGQGGRLGPRGGYTG